MIKPWFKVGDRLEHKIQGSYAFREGVTISQVNRVTEKYSFEGFGDLTWEFAHVHGTWRLNRPDRVKKEADEWLK